MGLFGFLSSLPFGCENVSVLSYIHADFLFFPTPQKVTALEPMCSACGVVLLLF